LEKNKMIKFKPKEQKPVRKMNTARSNRFGALRSQLQVAQSEAQLTPQIGEGDFMVQPKSPNEVLSPIVPDSALLPAAPVQAPMAPEPQAAAVEQAPALQFTAEQEAAIAPEQKQAPKQVQMSPDENFKKRQNSMYQSNQ
jgi:hypothetical protein